ncbi:MAG: nitrilase-related carbon-nitrogen hydrolase [Tepidimonas sp.]|uniref:nitrilase-related carbon-nitrogen hydrolase n=1 Tax=Tepidimonas sp. TaxID=2002775 RepID=UPI00259F4634|nr:nitrilase-related carbon-nitrogen hydrolase [Tepidimonas sp.]MDM7457601.1 nitrilase-related carbon-nitrogen hydrolase [Tepidimonas sp.]
MRIALWQTPHPSAGDGAAALHRLEDAAARAALQGAHWLVTPEMALTGYLIAPEHLAALAEPADGPLAQAVAAIARRHRLGIAYGWPERHPDGAKPWNAVQAIGPDGQRLAVHRKAHLFGVADRTRFTAGEALAAPFECGGWRIGLLICFDVEQPAAVRALARQGAQLILAPTANMLPYDDAPCLTLPRLAAESRVAIAYANACGAEGDTHYGGLSRLVGPDGRVVAAARRGEALLMADSPD